MSWPTGFDNPELKKLMPWAGVHENRREGLLSTFQTLNTFWTIDQFKTIDIFSAGENVPVFGCFTVHSRHLDKIFVSPFSVHAKVRDGRVHAGDPNGVEVTVGS